MREYKIVEGQNKSKFEKNVGELMNNGWEVLGSVIVTPLDTYTVGVPDTLYIQAMVKYELIGA